MRTAVTALALTLALLVGGGPAGAARASSDGAEPTDGDPTEVLRDSRIHGGSVAPAGAWPSQVALVEAGRTPVTGQFCGGTVVARTWVLTAAHCVTTDTGGVRSPRSLDVLAGTQDLTRGGARIAVAEVRRHPSYDRDRIDRDVALLRLDRPVPASAAPVPLAAPGTDPAGGTSATAIGWGRVTGGSFPSTLRQATLTMRNQAGCGLVNGALFQADTMVCATGDGVRGVCGGDSGGGLLVDRDGVATVVGVTSWTYECGARDSVFARASAFSSWVAGQVRYGPHPDAASFVRRQHLDLYGRPPTSSELFYGAAGLQDGQTPAGYLDGLLRGAAFDSRTGGVVRLYQAIFLRRPDSEGLMYWKAQVDRGVGLKRIADLMVRAPEFTRLYGSLDDGAFVDLVYDNVLERPPSGADRTYWVGELQSGRRTRGQVMVGFSESGEYRQRTGGVVAVIGPFAALVRRAPSAGEVSLWVGRPTRDLAASLLGSLAYASRF